MGPGRDVYEQQSGGYMVSHDLLPVCPEVVREAIASGAIVEAFPGKNGLYWTVPELVVQPRPRQYRKREMPRRRGRPRKAG